MKSLPIHHNILVKPLTEPLKNRIEYIKNEKAKAEEVYDKAEEVYDKAEEVYDKAEEAHDKAEASPVMRKLHAKECGCKYSFTKKTIFTKGNGLVKWLRG